MRLLLLAGCLGLASCGTAPVAGAVAGGLASYVALRQDADLGLAVVKPINATLVCPFAESQPHDAKTLAAIKAFCANLPTTVEDLPIQALAVVRAVDSTP